MTGGAPGPRPADEAMEGHLVQPKVAEALASLRIVHEIIPVDSEYADTEEFCARYGYPPETSGNCIIVVSKRGPKRYAACLVLATHRLDVNHKVRHLMGVPRASFAAPEETVELTGMAIGGVTPLGLPDGVPVYLDEGLKEPGYVVLGSGTRLSKIKTSIEELAKIPNATFEAGLGLPA